MFEEERRKYAARVAEDRRLYRTLTEKVDARTRTGVRRRGSGRGSKPKKMREREGKMRRGEAV